MGLFSKKPKEPEYDAADCERKKKRMREIFNEAVKDGDTYEVMYAYMSTSKFERGFVFDWNTTTFFCYIVGFRRNDFSLALVQIDAALQEHSDPFYVNMDNVGNVSYDPRVLLDFAEAFRIKLEQRGYKLDKWKR